MKTRLFNDPNLSKQDVVDNLEAENCGVEELHDFLRPFTEEEEETVKADFVHCSKDLNRLERQLKELSEPIKEEMKPIKASVKELIGQIQRGGHVVTEKVYCFPDLESKLMGLYDSTGTLVGTRPMQRSEKQLHINSYNTRAVGE